MALSNQELSELAQKIRERLKLVSLSRYKEMAGLLDPVVENMERLRGVRRRLRLCCTRQWYSAAAEVASGLARTVRYMTYDLNRLQELADASETQPPNCAELVADLRQAENEFGQLRYDRKNRFVAVATDAIELEEVYLGEFEIRLLLSSRDTAPSHDDLYRIVALDPHPASSDETVTHPHVRNECLCAGDAGAAIRSALDQGRICDFFLLVKAVLEQYNAGSPFVRLDNWEGGACYDCGRGMADESYGCPDCENDFCSECISSCQHCESSYCESCLSTCAACEESVCSNCLRRCPDCRKAICRSCLDENHCPCHQEKEKNDEPASTAIAAAS
jgi:hypothetical protein